jgi:hypothetical protein
MITTHQDSLKQNKTKQNKGSTSKNKEVLKQMHFNEGWMEMENI